ISLLKVPTPSNITLTYNGTQLVVAWDAIAGVSSYQVVLKDETQTSVPGTAQIVTQATFNVDGSLIVDGASYTAEITAIAQSATGSLTQPIQKYDPLLGALDTRLDANEQTHPGTVDLNQQTLNDTTLYSLLSQLAPGISVNNANITWGANNES